ncbi:scarecrow-like protein 14 [Rhodamnia argentea]|uniref:Scarecrow-like protein 14 n=1 Tax=Rhodamnia argentea TaxID=178133 RepID=A0ABM3HUF9_9MYRT|nr:scarecrow-like protein 14 [Rhodamnia argentea]
MNSEAKLSDSCRSGSLNGEAASNSDGNDFSKQILNYISSMLMEENMEDKLCLFFDPSLLRATEKSLHNVIILGNKHPALPNQAAIFVCQVAQSLNVLSPRTGRDCSRSNRTDNIGCTDNSREQQKLADDRQNNRSSFLSSPSGNGFSQSPCLPTSQLFLNRPKGLVHYANQNLASFASEFPVQYDSLIASQFRRGIGEPCKFLSSDIAGIDATENGNFSASVKKQGLKVGNDEEQQQQILFYSPRGRKNHEREELCEREGRITKQSAASMEEAELWEMFDEILLSEEEPEHFTSTVSKRSNAAVRNSSPCAQTRGSSSRGHKNHAKNGKNNDGMVDLRNLLILCAQAISTGDSRNAGDLLKQIRLHSSPIGDACQRSAHFFANGLDARLAGIAVQNTFTNLTLKRTPISELLIPHQTHYKAFPFTRIAISFADNMILKVAETAKPLHVIDFGMLLGCQWPLLIQLLSRKPGGPPKLRLTGIELPQHGFKPEERIVEAGRHLAKYCERFGVPFEFNAIVSQHWETIKIEELKIRRNEVLAVNCRYRFENLLDETAVENNPRDAVLKLIREMRPDTFVLSVVNGTFNSPFFVPRFRQALFHFSALFDIFDCNIPRDDIDRINIEREYYGRQVMNVVASEGKERVERPETYKQWHKRVSQAGFKQRPLDKALMKIYMEKVKAACQKDLMLVEDGHWMLHGWKGRILQASSSWETA